MRVVGVRQAERYKYMWINTELRHATLVEAERLSVLVKKNGFPCRAEDADTEVRLLIKTPAGSYPTELSDWLWNEYGFRHDTNNRMPDGSWERIFSSPKPLPVSDEEIPEGGTRERCEEFVQMFRDTFPHVSLRPVTEADTDSVYERFLSALAGEEPTHPWVQSRNQEPQK